MKVEKPLGGVCRFSELHPVPAPFLSIPRDIRIY